MARRKSYKRCEQCGKRAYYVEGSARRALGQVAKLPDDNKYALNVYSACSGKGFHFGHDPKAINAIEGLLKKGQTWN